jgi:tetratricopeptide (TPR) repeat protein
MKLLFTAAIVLIITASLAMGQADVTIAKKEFRTDKPGFEDAWKHVQEGDKYYSDGGIWYHNAMVEYKMAYVHNNKNAELNYKLGVSCLFSDKKEQSAEYMLKALSLKSSVADDILLLTGRALQYSGKFDDAINKINQWMTADIKRSQGNIERAGRYIEECKSAMKIMKDTARIEIRNMGGNINSSADEYSEVLNRSGDRMYFASRRETNPGSKNYLQDTKFDENIFRSDLENDKWSVALLASKKLLTENCETPLDIDPSGALLYVYSGYEGNGDIMVSELKKGNWRSPEPVSFGINTDKPETSFSISPSGNEIAFVSARGKNGAGGKDIYFIRKKGKKWTSPEKAGTAINSTFTEESVRFSRGGDTLWFSSTGHNSIGGFDIFFSARGIDGKWAQAVNAGYPINTTWDEFFYHPSPVSNSSFYLVSNRSGGFGGLDIYTGKVLPRIEVKREPVTDSIMIKPVFEADSIMLKPVMSADSAMLKPVIATDSIGVKTVFTADSIRVKADSVPKIFIQRPDSAAVVDTSAVKKIIFR